ncbi:MAG: radical SAM protein [Desulfobulbus sp.]|nr:MAG: radical SAM protein [Desulfobulbus sp.]
MNYEGDIIRPPSEAFSIILQATVGCSHNRCTFCGAYRDRSFRLKEEETVEADLAFAAEYCRRQKTLFLADGNGLAMPQARLVSLLARIRERLPWVRRVSLYANARDILRRSVDELRQLKGLGMSRLYMGLETGHDPTLAAIAKGSDSREMIAAGQRVREAGIFLSVSVLLGIAGRRDSQAHARATAAVLNAMRPNQVAALTLMLLVNTPLADAWRQGNFEMPDRHDLLRELRSLLVDLDLERAQFQANHASNYFELDGRLSRDKIQMIALVDQALAGTVALKPEYRRAL